MAERTTEAPVEQQKPSEFFSALSLNDIYGYYPVDPRTEIKTGRPYSHDLSKKETEELCRQYSIPSIGMYGGGAELGIHAGSTEKLTWWAPHESERRLLIRLVQSVAPSKDKPLVLDVGCGAGFVGKLLAESGSVQVIGIDKNRAEIKKIPETSNDVKLMAANIWNVTRRFGPDYQEPMSSEVVLRLGQIRAAKEYNSRLLDGRRENKDEEWRKYHRTRYLAKQGAKELQQLVPQYDKESPIDVVVNSFMDKGTDLTVPIRDGIYPKMIVYVKAVWGGGGKTGSGMPSDYDESLIRKNQIVSFDVGDNYRTVAHWKTLNGADWGHHAFPSDNLLSLHMDLTFEVVVQLRNDVQLTEVSEPTIPHYPWDDEIVDVLKKHGKDELFFGEISAASENLFTQTAQS